MEQAKKLSRAHIRVTLNEDKTVRRELMHGDTKVCDVSKVDIIEMIMQMTSTLRYE